jgi:hypothetical protein
MLIWWHFSNYFGNIKYFKKSENITAGCQRQAMGPHAARGRQFDMPGLYHKKNGVTSG